MKAFKVIFQRGHFVDIITGNRIIPVPGEEYIITANADAFSEEDEKFRNIKPLSKANKLTWVEKDFGSRGYIKLLDAGTNLFFRVGNSKKLTGEKSQQYIFTCALQEDLYIYKLNKRKGDSDADWRLVDCLCILDECLIGGLTITQRIQAESLNKLFSHVVTFYFPHQRSTACNAFSTFYLYDGREIVYSGPINETYESLGRLRKLIANEIEKAKSG